MKYKTSIKKILLFLLSICIFSCTERPTDFPECIYSLNTNITSRTYTSYLEADGYYLNLNNSKFKDDANSPKNFDKWIDTGIPLVEGQHFTLNARGTVGLKYETIVDFDPKIRALQNSNIAFQAGDTLYLQINDYLSNGSLANNYVNEGCDLFTDSCSSDPNDVCSCQNLEIIGRKNICRKSPREEAICFSNSIPPYQYGEWGIRGSGVIIKYQNEIINDYRKAFNAQGEITSVGYGGFNPKGLQINSLSKAGYLQFQAVDGPHASDQDYKNNIGNYAFKITRLFNIINNGVAGESEFGSIDYTIYSDDPNNSSNSYTTYNIPINAGENYNSRAKNSGRLWLRVHDDTPSHLYNTDNLPESLAYFNNKFPNQFPNNNKFRFSKVGGYFMEVNPSTLDTKFSDAVMKMVIPIQESINKAAKDTFNNTINSPSLTRMIKGLIILYITVYAISFMLGFVEVTQTDLVIRIFKMGILFALIATKTSWNFFNDHLFNMFLNGNAYLIQLFSGVDPSTGGGNIFIFIDITFAKFFTKFVWLKISALFFNGNAFFIGVMIIYGIWVYIMVIIEVILAYLIGLIALAFTISIAPLLLVCILFERTKSYFDNWMKYVLNFSLQPVLLFAVVFLIYEFVLVAFQNALSYPVCWDDCLIDLTIPYINYGICLEYYKIKDSSNSTLVYFSIFITVLVFCIFIKIFKAMLDEAPTLTSLLTQTSGAGAALSGSRSQAGATMQFAKDIVMRSTGLDHASKAERALKSAGESKAKRSGGS